MASRAQDGAFAWSLPHGWAQIATSARILPLQVACAKCKLLRGLYIPPTTACEGDSALDQLEDTRLSSGACSTVHLELSVNVLQVGLDRAFRS